VAPRIAHEGGRLALVDRSPLVEEVRQGAEAAGSEVMRKSVLAISTS